MKQLFLTIALALFATAAATAQSVGINTTPTATAALDVSSTTKGMLVPRMTTTQRNNIATANSVSVPATGLMVYDITLNGFYFYDGTAWTAVGGGTTLPSQTGNAGKVLTTDGTNLSWGTGVGASYEVYATITTAQTTSVGSSLTLPDAIYFGSNTSPAVLTGGNTFSNVSISGTGTGGPSTQTTSKFTATTAGLYFVDIQMTAEPTASPSAIAGIPMLDYNGTGNSSSSYYGTFYSGSAVLQNPRKSRGALQRLIYMSAGDYFYVRLASSSTVIGADPGADASNYIKIVKLR